MSINANRSEHLAAGSVVADAEYVRARDAVMAQPEVKFVNAFVGMAQDIVRWHRAR